MPPPEEGDSLNEQLAARDEILQVMYWLRGEGLAKDVAANDLMRWVAVGGMRIHSLLVELAEAKLVEPTSAGESSAVRFRLTAAGVKEGGRRFADEFADLTKPGHGECGDPDCDCKQSGNPADCRHHA